MGGIEMSRRDSESLFTISIPAIRTYLPDKTNNAIADRTSYTQSVLQVPSFFTQIPQKLLKSCSHPCG